MPDRWGRPTFYDGMNIARTFMIVDELQSRQQNRTRKLASDKNIDKYIGMIETGKPPDRNAPDFDYSDWLDASVKHMEKVNADENFKRQKLLAGQAQRETNQNDINDRIATSEGLAKQGKQEQALDVLLPIYQYFPDGNNFKGFKEGSNRKTMLMESRDGSIYERPTGSYQDFLQLAKGFSQNYQKVDQEMEQKVSDFNVKALQKRDIWKTADGKEAYYFLTLEKSGKYREIWKDPKTGKTLKGFDPATGETVKSDLDFRPPAYWKARAEGSKATLDRTKTNADIEQTKARTEQIKQKPEREAKKAAAKKLQDIAKRIDTAEKKAADIQAGVNVSIGADTKGAVQRLKKEAERLRKRYKKLGGDPRDLLGAGSAENNVDPLKIRF